LAKRNNIDASQPVSSNDSSASLSSRRTTVDIYADILEVVKMHGGHGRITKISYGVGMPVDRLKKFLDRLDRFGLVKAREDFDDDEPIGISYLLTARGQEFLDTYWNMKGFLEVLGGSM